MTQTQKVMTTGRATKPKVADPLARIRAAAQELHGAISDAVVKGGDVVKSDWEANLAKAKAVADSIQGSIELQDRITKDNLAQAYGYLESTQKHIKESLEHTGHAFHRSVRHSLADAYAAALKVSEALAAKRTAESKHSNH